MKKSNKYEIIHDYLVVKSYNSSDKDELKNIASRMAGILPLLEDDEIDLYNRIILDIKYTQQKERRIKWFVFVVWNLERIFIIKR